MKRMIIALVAAFICGSSNASQAAEVLWTYTPPSGYVDTSPAVGDLTGDGASELVVSTISGLTVALTIHGEELWRHEMRGPICIPPSIGDLTDYPGPEVVVMNRQGQLACLAGDTGRELWAASMPGRLYWGETALALGDVTGDGALEVVTGDNTGAVACFRGTGELLWMYQGDHGVTRAPVIADITGDGRSEILVGGDKVPLVCLSSDAKELWRLDEGVGSSPLVHDITGDGRFEILLGVGRYLTCLDGTGQTLWRHEMRREIDAALSVADADGDGEVEIYAVDLVGHFVCLSSRGQALWTADVVERVRRSPSIADIDGDGTPEILVAGYSNILYVFTPEGRIKERIPLPNSVNSTATVVSLAEGLGVFLPVDSEGLTMFRWPGSQSDGAVLWPEYRFDSRRSAQAALAVEETPVTLDIDLGSLYVGANLMNAIVQNPEERRITVRLEALRNEEPPAVSIIEKEDALIEHQLSYIVPSDRAVNLTLNCVVAEGDRVLARRSRTVYLVPFVKEMHDAAVLLDAVDDGLPQLLDRTGLEERSHFLRARIEALSARIPAAALLEPEARITLRDEIGALLGDINALRALVAAARVAAESDSVVIAAAANPWAPFGGLAEISEGRIGSRTLTVEAFGGETESAALNLFNLSSRPRAFRVELDDLVQEEERVAARETVALHEVLDVPTEMRDHSADALPLLNTAQVIQLPAWGARQLWLNVTTDTLSAGAWTSRVRLRSLDVEPIEAVADLKVAVWPARLPEEQALRLCHWGYVHRSLLSGFPEQALADQARNRTNVFVGLFYPRAEYDEAGNLVGELDFTDHDAYVKRHAPHGMILFFNYQHALKGPGGMGSEAYAKAHVQWLRLWVARLKELGLGYEDFALYPVDEPGLSDGLVERHLLMGKLAREADPNILLYTDPVGRITEEELRALLPYVDIWCPHRDGLILDKANTAKLDIILNSGVTLWTYECAHNVKHQSPLGYYRAQAWLAWHYGLTGIGFWSYCTSQDDPWLTPAHRHDYLLVYPGSGVVTSKRWEAVRDGVEDYMMLTALQDAIATSNATPETLETAKGLLAEDADAVAQFCGLDEHGTLLGAEDPALARIVADKRWERVKQIRRALARLLQAL